MSNIIKKLDNFRASTSFFVFFMLNGLFLTYFSLKQLTSVSIFNLAFYFQLSSLTQMY